MSQYEYPGEHKFDGTTFDSSSKPEQLRYIRDEMTYSTEDIIVATYPKSGTTWMQEIVWSLHHGPGSADKRTQSFDEIFPFMEFSEDGLDGLELVQKLKCPRFIKTHLPATFYHRQLQDQSPCPKFIIVLRNPKDTLVSYFHFHQMFKPPFKFPGTWDQFYDELFIGDRVIFGDYFRHAIGWWNFRNHPNVLVVRYENMKENPKKGIVDVSNFLGLPLADHELDGVVNDTSFSSMKARSMAAYSTSMIDSLEEGKNFFRKGQTGSWRELMSEEQVKFVDSREKEELHPLGLSFM